MTARIRWSVVKARTTRPPNARWASWARDHWRAVGRLAGRVKQLGNVSKPVLPEEVEPFLKQAALNLLALGEAPEFISENIGNLRSALTERLRYPGDDPEQALREKVRATAEQLRHAKEELRQHLESARNRPRQRVNQ
jgi:hypothetical protein